MDDITLPYHVITGPPESVCNELNALDKEYYVDVIKLDVREAYNTEYLTVLVKLREKNSY